MPDSLPTADQLDGSSQHGVAPLGPHRWLSRTFNEGQTNFANLSAYAFGLSGLWTGTGSVIQQIKVAEIVERDVIVILGMELGKAGMLGLVSMAGLAVAAIVQPISGILSDRGSGAWGKRLPFIFIGALGLSFMTFGFGAATTFATLLWAVMLMQLFGNMSQGPANALIVDNVPADQLGGASGALNFARVLGAGILTIVVLFMMGNYHGENGQPWLWASLTLMVAVLIASTVWTILTLRPGARGNSPSVRLTPDLVVRQLGRWARRREALLLRRNRRTYFLFLIAMIFVIAAMSSMQVYALYFMNDVVGLENAERGTALMVIVIAGSTLATVIPAGAIADRAGHERLILLAGLLGSAGALLLLLVNSLGGALLVGIIIGIAVGIFLSVTWALANSLVPRASAARDLGWTSVATFVGAAVARLSGLGIDALNARTPNLGYDAMILAVAIAFLISAVLMVRISGSRTEHVRTRSSVVSMDAGDNLP